MTNSSTFSATFTSNSDIIYYNIVGNFIPPEWRDLAGSKGQILSKTAKQLLSLIISCFEDSNYVSSGELQEGYYFFENKLGICQRRIRQCLVELEQGNFIKTSLRTIIKNYTKCRNILCISLIKNFQRYPTNFSVEPEINYSSTRNNLQPLHIIDNNISLSKSRYSNNVDNFVDNSEVNSQKQNEQEIITTNNGSVVTNNEVMHNENHAAPNCWINTIADKAKTWCVGKKLEEFYPLTEEDAAILRIRSNRDFNLNFINKLLMRLSEQRPNNRFYNKKLVLNYMAKALTYEMRQAPLVNNENFNFKVSEEISFKEQYLQQIEASHNISPQNQLKRKIASVFERDIAYQLLTSCNFIGVTDNFYKLELTKKIDIGDRIRTILLREVQAVYGSKVQQLQVISSLATTQTSSTTHEASYLEQLLQQLPHDSIWSKVRQYLIKSYDQHIDKAWFSKLEVIEEDSNNKKITLKPSTAFIGSWISQRYAVALRDAFQAQGFSYELVKA